MSPELSQLDEYYSIPFPIKSAHILFSKSKYEYPYIKHKVKHVSNFLIKFVLVHVKNENLINKFVDQPHTFIRTETAYKRQLSEIERRWQNDIWELTKNFEAKMQDVTKKIEQVSLLSVFLKVKQVQILK